MEKVAASAAAALKVCLIMVRLKLCYARAICICSSAAASSAGRTRFAELSTNVVKLVSSDPSAWFYGVGRNAACCSVVLPKRSAGKR